MVFAGGLLRQAGLTPPGDLLVAGVVMEETGGIGTRHLLKTHGAEWGLVGEPSGNSLRRGHRGRFEFQAVVRGRAAHASTPELAINPHYILADFLNNLEHYLPPAHPLLGKASMAPTAYRLDPHMANIIPGEITLTIDYRSLPGQKPEEIRQMLAEMLGRSLTAKASADVKLSILSAKTYTGLSADYEAVFPAFILPEDHPLTLGAGQALAALWGKKPPLSVWRFATDGGHMTAAGIPTIGFGPGDEQLAHTVEERLSLEQLQNALLGYSALAMLE
jgi:succinyl-diaminopimelate desuccinylase